jgi:hypothetical protein
MQNKKSSTETTTHDIMGKKNVGVVCILFWSVMMLLVLGVNGNEYFMDFYC